MARLNEHEGKALFKIAKMPIPQGDVAETPAEAVEGGAPAPWLLALDDDGTGFDPGAERHGHYGLTGLHEQAEQLGAVLAIDSAPGQGCRLRLRFTA